MVGQSSELPRTRARKCARSCNARLIPRWKSALLLDGESHLRRLFRPEASLRRTHLVSSLVVLALLAACGSDPGSTFPSSGDPAPADTGQPPPPFVPGHRRRARPRVRVEGALRCRRDLLRARAGVCRRRMRGGVLVGSSLWSDVLRDGSGVPLASVRPARCGLPGLVRLRGGRVLRADNRQVPPQPAQAGLCEYKPPVLPLAPKLEWSWTGSTIRPEYDQVINTPIVIDLDGDKIPEVIIVTSKGDDAVPSAFGQNDPAFLRVLDGKTGLEKWGANVDAYKDGTGGGADHRVNPRGTPAAADLDGDGSIGDRRPEEGRRPARVQRRRLVPLGLEHREQHAVQHGLQLRHRRDRQHGQRRQGRGRRGRSHLRPHRQGGLRRRREVGRERRQLRSGEHHRRRRRQRCLDAAAPRHRQPGRLEDRHPGLGPVRHAHGRLPRDRRPRQGRRPRARRRRAGEAPRPERDHRRAHRPDRRCRAPGSADLRQSPTSTTTASWRWRARTAPSTTSSSSTSPRRSSR